MTAIAAADLRTVKGQFAPGCSGNPAGRPKGARTKATLAAAALLEESGPDIMRKLIDASLGGDRVSARFLVGRLCPATADRPITLDVAPGQEGDLLAVHAAVMRAVCDGEITPKEGLMVARILAVGAKLIRLPRRSGKEEGAQSVPCPLAGEGGDPARRDVEREGSRPTASKGRASAPLSRLYFDRSGDRPGSVHRPRAGEARDPAPGDSGREGRRPASLTPPGVVAAPLPGKREREEQPLSRLYFDPSRPRAA